MIAVTQIPENKDFPIGYSDVGDCANSYLRLPEDLSLCAITDWPDQAVKAGGVILIGLRPRGLAASSEPI